MQGVSKFPLGSLKYLNSTAFRSIEGSLPGYPLSCLIPGISANADSAVIATCREPVQDRMKILGVTAFYRAPLGGLQENIRATVQHARRRGWHVRLALPDGPFRHSLRDAGFETLAVDFMDEDEVGAAADFLSMADVLHFHPGSKKVALRVADLTAAPLVYTIHGGWHDDMPAYANRLSCVICVSEAVRELASRSIGSSRLQLTVIPNGIDTGLFTKREAAHPPRILIASRLDADKVTLIDLVIALWNEHSKNGGGDIGWVVAGAGTELARLRKASESLALGTVDFAGWLDASSLACEMRKATAVVAPGRSAMEAIAMGLPTLAVGSGGASTVFSAGDLQNAARSNFGGYGSPRTTDVDSTWLQLRNAAMQTNPAFAREARSFILERFDNDTVNDAIVDRYEDALRQSARASRGAGSPVGKTLVGHLASD